MQRVFIRFITALERYKRQYTPALSLLSRSIILLQLTFGRYLNHFYYILSKTLFLPPYPNMKYSATILLAVAVGILSVRASPIDLQERAANADTPPVTKCLRQKYPGFPKDGKPSHEEIRACIKEAQPKVKREETPSAEQRAATDELIYEADTGPSIHPRGIVDTVDRLGKSLHLEKRAFCPIPELHNEFVWAKDVVSKANDICTQLKSQIDAYGLAEDGGLAVVIDKITYGHNKRGHQLQDNRKLIATYLLNFTPPAKMAVDDIKQIASGVYDLCNDGIERISTDGEGCVQNVKYYRPSKAKHYTDAGAKDGSIRMFFDKYFQDVASLSIEFTEDS